MYKKCLCILLLNWITMIWRVLSNRFIHTFLLPYHMVFFGCSNMVVKKTKSFYFKYFQNIHISLILPRPIDQRWWWCTIKRRRTTKQWAHMSKLNLPLSLTNISYLFRISITINDTMVIVTRRIKEKKIHLTTWLKLFF